MKESHRIRVKKGSRKIENREKKGKAKGKAGEGKDRKLEKRTSFTECAKKEKIMILCSR